MKNVIIKRTVDVHLLVVQKELEEMLKSVLGVEPKKTKSGKDIVYYPFQNHVYGQFTDASVVTVTCKKVTNTTTHIRFEYPDIKFDVASPDFDFTLMQIRKSCDTVARVLNGLWR